jgi:hypothetical protein
MNRPALAHHAQAILKPIAPAAVKRREFTERQTGGRHRISNSEFFP